MPGKYQPFCRAVLYGTEFCEPCTTARESLSDLTVNPSTERYEEGSVLTDLQ